jgi:glycyl-tRNA synthetase beta chain
MSARKDLLIEIGTEELPPTALRQLIDAFNAGVVEGFIGARLGHGTVHQFASPRRLALVVESLDEKQADRTITVKGPPVRIAFDGAGEPTKAALAFAKKCGVEISALGRDSSGDGEWLCHESAEPGQETAALVPGIVEAALDKLPIPRRMRWGSHDFEFVRPVHWLILMHGDEVIPGSVLGMSSGNTTRGHRFHSVGEIDIGTPGDYAATLGKKGYVLASFDERREKIVKAVSEAAAAAGGTALGDDALFDEVTALTEWPVPMTGTFDEAFLELPREVIVATLTSHQRYFPVADKGGALLPVFITLANLESKEPDRVRDGNERVIHPRLADAAFFWETDRGKPLADRAESLRNVVYQKGLGSLHDKSMRVAALAARFSEELGLSPDDATRAAVLAKCDLVTGMVGEFPELQGTMGGYYAAAGGEPEAVASAIAEQYLPRFAGDDLPETAAGQMLAVADKLDTLAGIFALGKKPSGNRDPFGLRRAALGVIRILVEKNLDLDLGNAIETAVVQQPVAGETQGATRDELYEYIMERARSYFLDQESAWTQDMFEAVLARRPSSLADFQRRLVAVAEFVSMDSAASLAAANKRTANILRQAGGGFDTGAHDRRPFDTIDRSLLEADAEISLYEAMESARSDVGPLVEQRAYTESLQRLAQLRNPVDTFFDDVMVMTEDEVKRKNRLNLLAGLRSLFLGVADISRLTPAEE